MANTAINHDPAATFPGSSTDTAVVKWSGTGGKTLVNSGVLVDASNNITGLNNVTATGYLHLTGDEKELRFYEGSDYVAIKTNASLGASYTLTLPLNDGAADEFLQTNGSGVLTWAAAAGTTINSNADNRIITGSGTANTLNGESTLTYSGTAMMVGLAGSPPTPDHVSMHIWEGSAGSVTASTDTQLIIEHSGNAGITILTPNSGTAQLSFGCPAENRQGSIFYDQSANMMTLRSGNDNLKRITLSGSSGDATIYSNLVIGTAGKGIDFSATANSSGSMSSELLDWYEEGTFTPVLFDNDLDAVGQGYSQQIGHYTRIGNQVTIHLKVESSSISNLDTSDGAKIGGLPFTAVNVGSFHPSFIVGNGQSLNLPAAGNIITAFINENTTYLTLRNWDSTTGITNLSIGEWSSDGLADISGTYEV